MNIVKTTGNKIVAKVHSKPTYEGGIQIVSETFTADRRNWQWVITATGPKCKQVAVGDIVLISTWNNLSVDEETIICPEEEVIAKLN